MSHFPVLVAVPEGKTLDDVMMPFHEFECTGIDQYIQDIDNTEEVQEKIDESKSLFDGLEYFGLEDRVVSNNSQIDTTGNHKYGYAVVVDGKLIKAIDRTNPNKKWDCYTIGGRWSNFIGRDKGTKIQFNFGQVVITNLKRKMDDYYKFQESRKEVSITVNDIDKAKELLDGQWKDNKKAHELYTHPVDLALDKAAFDKMDWWSWTADIASKFHMPEDEYRAAHEYEAPLHAFIDLNGQWVEEGDMGWWGICANENSDTFNGRDGSFWSFVNSLPDDTMLYVVDCHI